MLAKHAFEVGYFKLFAVKNTIPVDPALAHCIAVVHVHHDRNTMDQYNAALAHDTERFFTDEQEALSWLCKVV